MMQMNNQSNDTGYRGKKLIGLFKHFDTLHAGKENLFVPISFAFIPAIILAWDNIKPLLMFTVAAASLLLYWYHYLVLVRFHAIQDRIGEKLSEVDSDFGDILRPRSHELTVRLLRAALGLFLSAVWAVLCILKCCSQ